MCECHPRTPEWKKLWHGIRKEPRTREDWADLHDTIEGYRTRLVERHEAAAALKRGVPTREE